MIRVNLFLQGGAEAVGQIDFKNLMPGHCGHYTCHPEGILTLSQVQQVSDQIRHSSQKKHGTVGDYQWRETPYTR